MSAENEFEFKGCAKRIKMLFQIMCARLECNFRLSVHEVNGQ
jgi:hypothetical protein